MNYNRPVFRKDWYINALNKGPKALLNRIRLDIKWAYQRVQRGFSDYDASDIDIWFEYVMPGIISELKKQIEKTPGYMINGIDDELDEYCNQKRKEALEMLYKYFHCLWN